MIAAAERLPVSWLAGRDDVLVVGTWIIVCRAHDGPGAAPTPGADVAPDRPGPWRRCVDGVAFEVPVAAVDGARERLDAVLAWADATARGALPGGWEAPRDVDAAWVGPLTVRAGPVSAQGSLERDGRRLALVFPRLCGLPQALPASRRRWLDAVLDDAARRWRMVRLGVDAGVVRAEVDLSGAPAECLEPLVRTAAGALRWTAGWLLLPLSVLCDPALESRVLDRFRVRAAPAGRKQRHA